MTTIPKWYRQDYIRHRLATDGSCAVRCLMLIDDWYRAAGCGYRRCDAEFLNSLAEQYRQDGTLSPRQYQSLHKLMPKYAGQILREHADERNLLAAMWRDGWLDPERINQARKERNRK